MVLGATMAGSAAVGSWLWGYNRENFKFDREMRQKNEFKILDFRNVQAQLWREDIRDIISLTEKKMDSYLIISVLQLDACVGLFTEGRLEPGTPPWLLHLYMMTLGAAFMYLLMSVWFAMHASVVAQCSSVRLLTQFVRLPVPRWEDIEHMRTYASSYEKMNPAHWLRIPFTRSLATGSGLAAPANGAPPTETPLKSAAAASKGTVMKESSDTLFASRGSHAESSAASPEDDKLHADPWGLEHAGNHRGIYELSEEHPAMRRHILLARKAAAQYQCYDAFARVSMTFGTNQFLCALSYYALGYVGVQDGAPWGAVGVCITMGCVAAAMIAIDFSLTRCEQYSLQALIFIAIGAANIATFATKNPDVHILKACLPYMLPVAYVANGLWLFRALRSCGILEQENGVLLPTKFRAVLYLDVFGWMVKGQQGGAGATQEQEAGQKLPDAAVGKKKGQLSDPTAHGPSGQIYEVPEHAFEPKTFVPPEAQSADVADVDVVTGHDRIQPGRLAATVFRAGTWMLIALWVFGLALPYISIFKESLNKPLVADIYLEEMETEAGIGDSGMHAELGKDSSGLPELVPTMEDPESLPMLPGDYQPIKVSWPSHAAFVPRALSSNPSGTQLIVADDFKVYLGDLVDTRPPPAVATGPGGPAAVAWQQAIAAGTPAAAAAPAPALRGLAGAEEPKLELTFHEGTSCPGLQGLSLKDISVVCDHNSTSVCNLVVLTKRGQRLIECPFPEPLVGGSAWEGTQLGDQHKWQIAQDWLHASKKETVESLAVNHMCFHEARNGGASGFRPDSVGCAIVGTSAGRIVQMREAHADGRRLIPEKIMHQRSHPSGHGSLNIVKGRFLLSLWTKFSSISALDVQRGSMVKEWRLPTHIKWLMLSAGGDSLFLVGVRGSRHVELFRFEMPPELRTEARVDV